jgi:hypothetical protein
MQVLNVFMTQKFCGKFSKQVKINKNPISRRDGAKANNHLGRHSLSWGGIQDLFTCATGIFFKIPVE